MSGLMDLISQHIGKDQISQIAQANWCYSQNKQSLLLASQSQLCWGRLHAKPIATKALQQLTSATSTTRQWRAFRASSLECWAEVLGRSSRLRSVVAAVSADLLGSILGGRQSKVEQGIGKASGLERWPNRFAHGHARTPRDGYAGQAPKITEHGCRSSRRECSAKRSSRWKIRPQVASFPVYWTKTATATSISKI